MLRQIFWFYSFFNSEKVFRIWHIFSCLLILFFYFCEENYNVHYFTFKQWSRSVLFCTFSFPSFEYCFLFVVFTYATFILLILDSFDISIIFFTILFNHRRVAVIRKIFLFVVKEWITNDWNFFINIWSDKNWAPNIMS